ncbi:MAG: DNA-processing protein DprA [Candidatus Marinimicrobia bacterium]|nr:DNA-processing protein DprA [Candidatus Neomarinimicrobiota bacterium]
MSYHVSLLQLYNAKSFGNKKLGEFLMRLNSEGRSLEEIITSPEEELIESYNLNPSVIESINSSFEESEQLYNILCENDIKILVRGQGDYPVILEERLKNNAPAILFAKGNLGILDLKSISISGSRKASEEGLLYARELSKIVAKKNINLVGGYAQGIDLESHASALMNGGVTTLVLAEGILKFQMKGDFYEFLDDDNILILSEFPPNLPWTGHNAMNRNSMICGLANSMLVIEAAEKSGSLSAGNTALNLHVPLFVINSADYSNVPEGNSLLLKSGGHPVNVDSDGIPDLDQILESIENPDKFIAKGITQLEMKLPV